MATATTDSELSSDQARILMGAERIPIRRTPAPLIRRLHQICATMVAAALTDAGVIQLEYAVMVFIDDAPGIDQQNLSTAMGIDRSNVSLILEKLEDKGLVERRVNGADRRARELFLTAKGRNLWRRFQPKVKAANDRIVAPLKPGERRLFIEMLVRLVEENRLHARPGAGRRKRGSLQSPLEKK